MFNTGFFRTQRVRVFLKVLYKLHLFSCCKHTSNQVKIIVIIFFIELKWTRGVCLMAANACNCFIKCYNYILVFISKKEEMYQFRTAFIILL